MDPSKIQFDKYTKTWKGPKAGNFFDADCSIGKILFAFMRSNPKYICQISDTEGTALNNCEAITFAIRVAQHFKSMGLGQDDIVGIINTNTTYMMPVIVGCLLNCTAFHVIPYENEATLKYLFNTTRPKAIFCDGNIYSSVDYISKILKAKVITLKNHLPDLPSIEDLLEPTNAELFYLPETLKLGGDQTVAILGTAGTTGIPKNVCKTNSSLLFDYGFITGQDVLLSFSPTDTLFGLMNMLVSCSHGSTRIITDKLYSPEYLLELVTKYKISCLSISPNYATRLAKCPDLTKPKLESIRSLNIDGGYCPVSTILKLQSNLTNGYITYGYALTECGDIAINRGVSHPHSAGKLVPGVEVKIMDEHARCLGQGEAGEIFVNTGKVWNGYYGNPYETKCMQDYQGWFHTGDFGFFDKDNHLYVINRKSESLTFHGMQYWPHEIEQCVAIMPDVVEVCVFGLWNDVDGDAAAAAVVKLPSSKLSEQEIVEYVAKRLVVTHKQLHCGVFFVDELPKTSSGKVLRERARDLALGKHWESPKTLTNKMRSRVY